MKRTFFIFSIVLITLIGSVEAQLYNFKRYSIEEDLPRSGVYSLCEDSKGFLWIGTEGGGVSVFDGDKFQTYTTEDGLASNVIRVVYEDDRGRLWFGTQGKGVSEFNGKTFFTYSKNTGLPNDDIRSIAQDDRGNIWLGTFGAGTCKLDLSKDRDDEGFLTTYTKEDGLPHDRIRCILRDSKGIMWFGTDSGICSYNGSTFRIFTPKDGIPNDRILTIYEDGSKKLWFGTPNGVVQYDGNNFITYTLEDGLIQNRVRAIAQDNNGNLWFGTRDGVSKFDGTKFIHFTEKQGLSNNRIRSIITDSSGNLWFGTYFGGINKYTGDDFIHYTELDGILNNQIMSVAHGREDDIWLGTYEGVSHLIFKEDQLQQVINISEDDGLANGVVHCIYQDNKDILWFGTEDGISIYNGRRIRNIGQEDGLIGNEIFAILQDSQNKYWIGTNSGLSLLDMNNTDNSQINIKNYTIDEGLAGEIVTTLYFDNKENLWVGFRDGGVSVFTGETFINPEPNTQGFNRISSIIGDPNENIWIGTEENGIFFFSHENTEFSSEFFQHFSTRNGLTSNSVYLLIFDDEGNLWAGTERGVNKIRPDFSSIKHYEKEEGFIGIETNSNAVCKDASGRLWFGTIKGVTCYNPFASSINRLPPYTHITRVRIYSGAADIDPGLFSKGYSDRFFLPINLVLPHNKNNIDFDFIGISFKIPSRVLYSWKLEGFDREWISPTSRLKATYTNLSPGEYSFFVKASNDDNIWNQEATRFNFRIRPPFWRTWWFFAVCGILGLGLFVLYSKLRERMLIKEKRVLEEKVEERTVEINRQKEEIAAEKTKSDELLLNILPKDAAEELKLRGKASPKHYDLVTVLFTDFVGFTMITEKLSHNNLVSELDRYFIRFDEIIENYNLEKIKTVGDSYMCAGGIRIRDMNHPISTILAGLEMQRFMHDANVGKKFKDDIAWNLRIGINTGSVIAGVVGKKKFTYDIWGDTVNIASRMESSGEPGKVNISGTTHDLVQDYFICSHRGKIPAKNKGHVDMYFVDKIKPELSINGEGLFPNDAFFSKLKKAP